MRSKGSQEGKTSAANLMQSRFGLTPGEVRVAMLVSDGLSYADIAARLQISVHTVHTHIKEIHRKLGVHSNGRAAALIRKLE
jgi:DNA-binding CsgD family transcriptional regulator